jgi:hypothetical protein
MATGALNLSGQTFSLILEKNLVSAALGDSMHFCNSAFPNSTPSDLGLALLSKI